MTTNATEREAFLNLVHRYRYATLDSLEGFQLRNDIIAAYDAASAERASAEKARVACNACDWSGPVTATDMLGSIGPLCPCCRETTTPIDADDCTRLDWIDKQAADGVHIEVMHSGSFSGGNLKRAATVFLGNKKYQALSVRDAIDAAMNAEPTK